MDLCKHCGNKVIVDSAKETVYCTGCAKEISRRNDTIASWRFEARMEQLKAMHELMRNANDETVYMTWIYLMPDEPSEEDFKDIAMDDEQYNDCFDLFVELIQGKGNRW